MVVAFAPLVLIPFAFKLAGGAISAVMNAGAARTSSLSRQARQGLTKMRQDPNSLYGKAYNRNMEKRLERGQTAGQVAAGAMGAFRRNGQGIRKGYSTASGALGVERNLARQSQLGELSANAPVMNNDDALMAGLFLMDEQGYAVDSEGPNARRLRKGEKKVYRNEAQMANYLHTKAGYSEEDAAATAASISRARGTAGTKQWDTFAVTQLAGTGTAFKQEFNEDGSYKGGGQIAFNNALLAATEEDGVLIGSQVAKARSKFTESKRFDTISGYGTQMKAIGALRDGEDASKVHDTVMKNVVFTQGPGALVAGRGDSVRGITPQVLKDIKQAKKNLDDAISVGGGAPTAQQKLAIDEANKQLSRELASASALHDVAGQVSKENAGEYASGVLEQEIDGRSVFQMIEERMNTDPNFGAVKKGLGQMYTMQATKARQDSDRAAASRVAEEAAAAQLALERARGNPAEGPNLSGPSGPII
jgi:hypothetical protein